MTSMPRKRIDNSTCELTERLADLTEHVLFIVLIAIAWVALGALFAAGVHWLCGLTG